MDQYQPHNSIDPSLQAPPFFSTSAASSDPPPVISDISPVVNFAPAQLPLPNQTSYDGMIMAAISGLGEKDGSSRQAIARYIERVFNNLPSNHSLLLTNHLKKLKNSGQIVMVKHSYMLPSGSAAPPPLYATTTSASYSFSPATAPPLYPSASDSAAPPFMAPPPQFMAVAPPFSITSATATTTATGEGVATSGASPPPSQPKKRGRPPKAKTDLPPAHLAQNYAPAGLAQAQFQNYAPPANGLPQTQNYAAGPIGSAQNVSDGLGEVSAKRKPGRPRKEKPIPAQYSFPTGEAQTASFPPGVAPINPTAATPSTVVDQNSANPSVVDPGGAVAGAATGASFAVQGNGAVSGSEAMLVSLGLSDGPSPTKMRPRRSQKPTTSAPLQPGAVAQNGGKRRPGRPKKVNPGVAPPAPGVYPVQVPVGTSPPPSSNRGRGRPRKYAVAPGAPPPNGVVNGLQPKKRGRKPKNVNQAAAFAVPVSFMLPEQMNAGGAVMMPQAPYVQAGGDGSAAVAQGQVPVTSGFNGVAYPPMKRGRGRPPRTDGLAPRTDGGGMKKARKLSGKPLGRPRKNLTNSEDQSFEIVYLKSKLSYFQSKIKDAVPVIKAYLNGEEANAMGALGQLEELATEDVGAALKAQNQQQPPAQHLQTEQQ